MGIKIPQAQFRHYTENQSEICGLVILLYIGLESYCFKIGSEAYAFPLNSPAIYLKSNAANEPLRDVR